MPDNCFICGQSGENLYGYPICRSCRAKLGLFTDQTIKRQAADYDQATHGRTYAQEIERRLGVLDQDCKKKKIKLLHILDRLSHLE